MSKQCKRPRGFDGHPSVTEHSMSCQKGSYQNKKLNNIWQQIPLSINNEFVQMYYRTSPVWPQPSSKNPYLGLMLIFITVYTVCLPFVAEEKNTFFM